MGGGGGGGGGVGGGTWGPGPRSNVRKFISIAYNKAVCRDFIFLRS